MSNSLPPPPPPPAGPPGPPPSGPPEYLDSGAGAPVPPPASSGGSGLKKGLFVGGGVLGLAAVGVGAWAAYSFMATGAQPAEALPAGTLGYVSIDLDPSGGQKIEALRTLNKFPAFEDQVGIDSDDDIREYIFDEIQGEADCAGLDYADDIEPWLGDRAAAAAVDTGGDSPAPVFVVQVKDAGAAEDGLAAIKDCAGGGDGGAWVIEGDWAVVAETEDIAQGVIDDTGEGSLADDEDFQRWTGEAGDSGVMTMYAGPALGTYLAEHPEMFDSGAIPDDCAIGEECADPGDDDIPDLADLTGGMADTFKDFKGAAATVRFNDGAIELETAADGAVASGTGLLGTGGTADVVSSLPADTVAAFGLGFGDGWFSALIDQVAPIAGSTPEELMDELSAMSGLDLPDDAEKLAGDSAAVAIGPGFDPQTFFDSGDASDVPVAIKIKGDANEVQSVLAKLQELAGPGSEEILGSSADGDAVAIGPSEDYREKVLEDGSLGDDDVFKDVIREADDASTVLFVNVNQIEDAVRDLGLMGDDTEFLDNLKPISGFGASGWVDGDVAHGVIRLTTD